MEVGKYYKITKSYFNSFAPELSPQGTIVRCSERVGHVGVYCTQYKIKLEDNCGKILKRRCTGWLFDIRDQKNGYEELCIKDIRKLKLKKVNERSNIENEV